MAFHLRPHSSHIPKCLFQKRVSVKQILELILHTPYKDMLYRINALKYRLNKQQCNVWDLQMKVCDSKMLWQGGQHQPTKIIKNKVSHKSTRVISLQIYVLRKNKNMVPHFTRHKIMNEAQQHKFEHWEIMFFIDFIFITIYLRLYNHYFWDKKGL